MDGLFIVDISALKGGNIYILTPEVQTRTPGNFCDVTHSFVHTRDYTRSSSDPAHRPPYIGQRRCVVGGARIMKAFSS